MAPKPWERDWSGSQQQQPTSSPSPKKPWEQSWDTVEVEPAPKEQPSMLESLGRGALAGITSDFDDEAIATIVAANPNITREQALAELRSDKAAAEQANPWTYGAGQVGGAIAQGVALPAVAAAGKIYQVAKNAPLLTKLAQGAANLIGQGAVQGAVQGLGQSEATDIAGLTKDTATGAGVGAVASPIVGGALAGATKVVPAAIGGVRLVGEKLGLSTPAKEALSEVGFKGASELVGEGDLVSKAAQSGRTAKLAGGQVESEARDTIAKQSDKIAEVNDSLQKLRDINTLLGREQERAEDMFRKQAVPEARKASKRFALEESKKITNSIKDIKKTAQEAYEESVQQAVSSKDPEALSSSIMGYLRKQSNSLRTSPYGLTDTNSTEAKLADFLEKQAAAIDKTIEMNPSTPPEQLHNMVLKIRQKLRENKELFQTAEGRDVYNNIYERAYPQSAVEALQPATSAYKEAMDNIRALSAFTKSGEKLGLTKQVGSAGAYKTALQTPELAKKAYPKLTEEQAITLSELVRAQGNANEMINIAQSDVVDTLPPEILKTFGPHIENARELARQRQLAGIEKAGRQAELSGLNQEISDLEAARRGQSQLMDTITRANAKSQENAGRFVSDIMTEAIPDRYSAPKFSADQARLMDKFAQITGRETEGFNPTLAGLSNTQSTTTEALAKVPLLGQLMPTAEGALVNRARLFDLGQTAASDLAASSDPATRLGMLRRGIMSQVNGSPETASNLEVNLSPAAKAELKILKLRPPESITPEVVAGLAKKHGLTPEQVLVYLRGAQ